MDAPEEREVRPRFFDLHIVEEDESVRIAVRTHRPEMHVLAPAQIPELMVCRDMPLTERLRDTSGIVEAVEQFIEHRIGYDRLVQERVAHG